MGTEYLRTSKEWYSEIKDKIQILDYEGWDSNNFDYSFNLERISKQEFYNRLYSSKIESFSE